jgi:hypothetical protein
MKSFVLELQILQGLQVNFLELLMVKELKVDSIKLKVRPHTPGVFAKSAHAFDSGRVATRSCFWKSAKSAQFIDCRKVAERSCFLKSAKSTVWRCGMEQGEEDE